MSPEHTHHDHQHHHLLPDESGEKSLRNITVALGLNLLFTVVEILGGLYTNSLAILSDALHDLGDSIGLGAAAVLERLAGRRRTERYSYGFRRYSLLSALLNSIVLLAGAALIISRAVPRIVHPESVRESGMLVLAIFGILVNGIAMLRMKGGRKLNERAVMLHFLEDTLGWVAVLVGSVVMMFADLPVLDPLLSLAITVYAASRAIVNLVRTMRIFLQGVPPGLDVDSLIAHISGMKPIVDVHDVHVWTLDGEYNVLTLHVVVPDDCATKRTTELRAQIRGYLAEQGIQHATIEVGRESEDCGLAGC